jgi:HAD superfamily hydrolase (TIGR01549 family)
MMMVTTVLLDLDNTLLGNDMKDFLPPYFAGLEKRLRQFVEFDDLPRLMYASIRAMQATPDETTTNMACFMADFGTRLNCRPEILEQAFERFYAEDFPYLQQVTTLRAEARELVAYLLAGNYKVVVATNPLFPAVAIEQRLTWAGIAGFPYTLVTTMENSHFIKPDPRYYREILAKIESTPAESWMVGDNLKNDIEPAQALGLKTWWITDPGLSSQELKITPDRQGSLADFLAWIKQGGFANA